MKTKNEIILELSSAITTAWANTHDLHKTILAEIYDLATKEAVLKDERFNDSELCRQKLKTLEHFSAQKLSELKDVETLIKSIEALRINAQESIPDYQWAF